MDAYPGCRHQEQFIHMLLMAIACQGGGTAKNRQGLLDDFQGAGLITRISEFSGLIGEVHATIVNFVAVVAGRLNA